MGCSLSAVLHHMKGSDRKSAFSSPKSKLGFLWDLVDLKRIRWEGPALTLGNQVLEFDFKYEGRGPCTMAFNNFSGMADGGIGVLCQTKEG